MMKKSFSLMDALLLNLAISTAAALPAPSLS
jgi:hypothetical protein